MNRSSAFFFNPVTFKLINYDLRSFMDIPLRTARCFPETVICLQWTVGGGKTVRVVLTVEVRKDITMKSSIRNEQLMNKTNKKMTKYRSVCFIEMFKWVSLTSLSFLPSFFVSFFTFCFVNLRSFFITGCNLCEHLFPCFLPECSPDIWMDWYILPSSVDDWYYK